MQYLDHLTTTEDLSGTWCNSNAVTSGIMEAVSFVTPVLENFFVRTVAEGIAGRQHSELDQRCLAFMREEAEHSREHKKFNSSLLKYLGRTPPGLALVESLLDSARKHLSLSNRLLLAAAMEHFAAVLSKVYMNQETRLDIHCAFAKALFAEHAREELDHRSVVFDLWRNKGSSGSINRSLTVLAILFTGFVYVSIAVPWIVHRKTRSLATTLTSLAGFAFRNRSDIKAYSPLPELFSFVRRSYHPDQLVDDSLATRTA
jgi:predicted metal-dependent hydrolase